MLWKKSKLSQQPKVVISICVGGMRTADSHRIAGNGAALTHFSPDLSENSMYYIRRLRLVVCRYSAYSWYPHGNGMIVGFGYKQYIYTLNGMSIYHARFVKYYIK